MTESQRKLDNAARRWASREFKIMSNEARWDYLDQEVLGCLDWREWFDVKPPTWGRNRLFDLCQQWSESR